MDLCAWKSTMSEDLTMTSGGFTWSEVGEKGSLASVKDSELAAMLSWQA
jgi:subtilase family serine protease